jgi:G3E family GTPase
MRTTVVSGMLGAGKTTFIGHLLADRGERAVVLVNDFGALGIDGERLAADGIEAVELPSGCVCCTLRPELLAAVGGIVERFRPEHLVIEPSGVASPSGILEALAGAPVGPVTVVGLVDASEFLELHRAEAFGAFFADQIANADVVLVNKADLAAPADVAETVAVIEGLNPSAVVLATVQARLETPLPAPRRPAGVVRRGHAHFRFETLSLRLAAGTRLEQVRGLLRQLREGRHGRVVRAKALAQTERGAWRFDLAFGDLTDAPFARPVADGRMVVIGEALDRSSIGAALGAPGPEGV